MALKWLRDNLRHLKFVLWGVVAVFVLLVFVDWGAGGAGGRSGGSSALQIGDRSVSEAEFLNQMRMMDQQFSRIYRERWNELRNQVDLAGQTARYFIDRELQLDEAREVGITVTDEELQEAILENPNFQRENGEFVGQELYERIVRASFQMSVPQFEAVLAEDIMIEKLNAIAARSVWVGDDEVEREYRRQRETADLDVIQLRYEPYLDQVSITEDEAVAAFEADAEAYARDEQRVLRYLLVDTSRLRRLLPVEDGELQAYYDEHADEFLQGEQANARHILIRLAPDASEEDRVDAELHAGGVAKIARTGADFAELVAIHSEDPGTKDNGGDLGWFGRGRMVKEFEDAVFSAKPGDILGPVKSQFGYHIIKVEGFRPAHQQPLEEVKEQVRARVLEGRASAEAEARATALAKRLQTEQPTTDEGWSAIADEDEAVTLNRSLPFENGMPIAGASEDGTLATAAFDAEEGEIRGPLTVRRGLIVWQVAEVVPAGIPPFEEVRAAVEQELRRERALELAAVDAEELAAAWRDGSEPAELADRYDADVTPASAHRRGASIGTLGPLPAVDREVFAAEAGTVITPQVASDRGVVVVRVNSVERVGTEEIAQQLEMLRSQLMAERAAQLIRSMVDERRQDTPITMDNELMQRFAPRAS